MTGGTWETQNKVRPGAYINFESNTPSVAGLDSAGKLIIPLSLDWGPTGQFVEVNPKTAFKSLFGKALDDIKSLRESFKATSDISVYNLSGAGEKATATSTPFIATAKYGGTDGNKITVVVTKGLTDSTVKTFFEGSQVDSQVVATAADLVANDYVVFSGELPAADATLSLAGGTTVASTSESYADFATALDMQNFKVVAVSTSDESIKQLMAVKVKQLRESQGKNVTLVVNDYNTADYKGVVSVLNGVTLTGGEVLPAADALYWYAGAYAAATTNSLTYAEYPGAIDVERLGHDDIVDALKQGHIVYTYDAGADGVDRVVVEQDINTFRSFTPEHNQDFRKNKLVRTMDIIANNVQHIYSRFFIGKVTNNLTGRNLFKGQIMTVVLDPLVGRGAIDAYIPDEITITEGVDKDGVVVEMSIKFNDAMEKLYMTVNCQ
ncbi:phage tail sheath C-terminal domain-containing protein [Mesobacillus stamsii]|uniref:Phage tail sheath protein n=1 Tax=Mesobacillus stamsii TaxID=225347 RepID=A0ABU0FSC2_9BACI|nr:phage tail sheath C-terminal domain-containing protein [Mesobacillus stamsii]MDQ0412725.1 hypothetical protein [Mesobacillus stamsii]